MTQTNQAISPVEMNKDLVLSKCDYFVDVHLWPIKSILDPLRWLENFDTSEMDHAVHLLNSFIYFSDQLINEMFIAAFQCLSNTIRHSGDSFLGAQASWRSFIDIIIVTPVTGEIPNITDSGNIFARKSRQQLRINEERILNTSDTLKLLVRKGLRPVVFVDDFVGSGNQFIETWKRKVQINGSVSISFKDISSLRGAQFFYCPLLCTEYGYNRIKNELPEIVLSPTHIIPSKYSSIAHDSIIWPSHLRPTAYDFLYNASVRAGIKDTGGGVNDWRGFHKLALAVAFEHSVPDATLPIFYWEENGWKPLIRRN